MDELNYTDEEITTKLEISKQLIYDARKRSQPLLDVLDMIEAPRLDVRNKDVQTIIDTFSEQFGTTKSSPYDRYAAKRLGMKHGTDTIETIIKALASHAGEQFCPSVNSVRQLEEKLPSIMSFLKKQTGLDIIEL